MCRALSVKAFLQFSGGLLKSFTQQQRQFPTFDIIFNFHSQAKISPSSKFSIANEISRHKSDAFFVLSSVCQ